MGLATGCQVGDVGSFDDDPGDGSGGDLGPIECEGPLGPPRDPAALPACCPEIGDSHCLDSVPGELRDFLGACDGGGFCVPDKFIRTGGVFEPKECASIAGAAGRCLSACIPQVSEFANILPQDVCDAGELCTPCINPLDNQPTGACDIAFSCDDDGGDSTPLPPDEAACPHEGPPVIDPLTLPSCDLCGGGASCLTTELVPAELRGQLADCDATSKCVPNEFIASGGNFIPATCASVAGVEGRCLSECLPDVAAQADLLPQSTCAVAQRCVPCFDPLTGESTGACELSCDPGPESGPTALPACCGGEGTCVPAEAAGENADQLGEDTCPEDQGFLCAPNVFLEPSFTPARCETGFISLIFGDEFEPGACLPECLPAVDNFLIGQDGCADGFKCAPCLDPLSGDPTGACEL